MRLLIGGAVCTAAAAGGCPSTTNTSDLCEESGHCDGIQGRKSCLKLMLSPLVIMKKEMICLVAGDGSTTKASFVDFLVQGLLAWYLS